MHIYDLILDNHITLILGINDVQEGKPAFLLSQDQKKKKKEILGFKLRIATLQNPDLPPNLSPHLPEVFPKRKTTQQALHLKT